MAKLIAGGVGSDKIDNEVRALEAATLEDLRTVWRRRKWGAPPKMRSVELLRMIIAWRIQSAAYGGIDAATRQRLRSSSIPRTPNPPVGTRVTREYRGVLYHVEILEAGVSYAGQSYGSLSEVARLITGTRWNGPKFFGLRLEARA